MNADDIKSPGSTVVGFLEVVLENITLDGLKMIKVGGDRFLGSKSFTYVLLEENMRVLELRCFVDKVTDIPELWGIRSTVQFELEEGLWIPRRLQLCDQANGRPKNFEIWITREVKHGHNDLGEPVDTFGLHYEYKLVQAK